MTPAQPFALKDKDSHRNKTAALLPRALLTQRRRDRLPLNWLATGCTFAMRSVGAFEAKAHLAALLDAVGEGEEITITRHGRPVARLVPPEDTAPPDVAGTIARLRAFNAGQSLAGLSWQALRDQGRP